MSLPNQEKKSIKFDVNSISVIPLQESYNLRYAQNLNNNELDYKIDKIINDPKYSNEKRSKSAFSKKSFREKYESIKIKIPTNREWNRDPTAELIIRNLEQKIDILTYENFILIKKLKEIMNNNKELKFDISKNLMIMKAEQDNNEDLLNNKNNFNNNINNIKGKDLDNLYEEINRLKDENNQLKLSNQNLAESNAELNKVIENLKNNIIKSGSSGFNEKLIDSLDKNNNNFLMTSNNTDNNININVSNNKEGDEQYNCEFDLNKLILNEEQYKELIEENELLHKKLRALLLIEEDNNKNKNLISISQNIDNDTTKSNVNNINNYKYANLNEKKISIKEKENDDLAKENYSLKQKIKSLNGDLNRMAADYNQKLLIIQDKLTEYETKQKQALIENKLKKNYSKENEKSGFKKEEEIDLILNETLSVLDRNQDDEESKKMIETIKNIQNSDKKRISQCLIINNKLKSLIQENTLLQNKLLSSQKEPQKINFINTNSDSMNNTSNNNNKSSELNFIEKDYYNIDKLKKEKNEGFEDYLLGKIVNNQKEVLGERAPRFYESNNNNNFMAKSMNYDENYNRMNNRYNNYHYRTRLVEDYE